MKALHLHITGIVQGVGFRPFVYNLAVELGLAGWVLNASDGVYVLVQGPAETVDAFPDLVRERKPTMSVVEDIVAEEVEPEPLSDFAIRASRAEEGAMTLVSPDIATCPDCLAELFSAGDRRERYPFINCTNCGPRFTIIEDVPYDRPMTTMRDFPMCERCAAEYGDPRDRRFHAQPDACFICGPRLYLNPPGGAGTGAHPPLRQSSSAAPESAVPPAPAPGAATAELAADAPPCPPAGFAFEPDWRWTAESEPTPRPHRDRAAERERSDAIVSAVAELLRAGCVVAMKGLGGIPPGLRRHQRGRGPTAARAQAPLGQAARGDGARPGCRAGSSVRWATRKPSCCSGSVRPIVLLRRRRAADGSGGFADALAWGVAEQLTEVGVMLPYTRCTTCCSPRSTVRW